MIGSLYAGISGLNANMTSMSVIGDNIANVNTVAFKNNMAIFSNVLSQAMGGGAAGAEIGRGAQLSIISEGWTQGALETTGNGTDLAVNGRGFFICKDDAGLPYYTRAGVFKFNEDGYLVNPESMIVQGFSVDPQGNLGSLTDVRVNASTFQPAASQEMTTTMNLDADATDGHARLEAYNPADPDGGLIFRAVNPGVEANGYTVTMVGSPGGAVDMNVTGNAVTITYDYDSGPPPTGTTADTIELLINNETNWTNAGAPAQLFTADVTGDGTGLLLPALPTTNMS
ncbi:MAG: flagellar hook-basal body complex protein, partial [Desulfobacterales bacterium]|nr:flagellar hook-basal body complex protein [Desulfobacterales bacterium]